MGMNAAGLAQLWQTVADGSSAPGFCVPTQLLMREILATATTTAGALALARALPACVSNNLDFADPTGALLSVETGPGGRWAAAQAGGGDGAFLAHTNEFLWDQRGAANERSVDPTSVARGAALRGFLNATAASGGFGGSLAGVKARYASPPIFQGTPATGSAPMRPSPAGIYTSVVLMFDVARRELHYRLPFEEGAAGEEYRVVSLAAAEI
jgi:hypothetical protein